MYFQIYENKGSVQVWSTHILDLDRQNCGPDLWGQSGPDTGPRGPGPDFGQSKSEHRIPPCAPQVQYECAQDGHSVALVPKHNLKGSRCDMALSYGNERSGT